MAVAKTNLAPQDQVRVVSTYTDNIAPGQTTLEPTVASGASIEDNLHGLISQINRILNATTTGNDWFVDINTPSSFEGGAKRGVRDLNTDLHNLERKRILKRVSMVGVDVPNPGSALLSVLATGDLPTNTTAAIGAVTTQGTVVATAATFGTASLDEVTGSNALQPKNLLILTDTSTGDVVTRSSDDKQVFGLFQSESSTDGSTFTGTTPNRVQISFVVHNSANDDLELIQASDMSGIVFDYAYVERDAFDDLNEQDFLGDGFTDIGASTASRQTAYSNQGTTVVTTTTNATLDLGTGFTWEMGDAASASLMKFTEGSTGGTTNLTFGSDVDTYVNSAVDVDFTNGITVDTSDAINIGITTDQIDFTGNATITGTSGSSITVQSVAASVTVGTTTSGNLNLSSVGAILSTTQTGGATGGEFDVTCGTGTTTGGAIDLNAGAGATNGTGGAVTVDGGAGAGTGDGGAVSFTGGASGAGATGDGGTVTITSGSATSTSGSGGTIVLVPGASTGSGTAGYVHIDSALDHAVQLLRLDNSANADGDAVGLYVSETDPSAGGGLTADVGSFLFRDVGGAGTSGQAWLKSGSGDTAWTQLSTAAGSTLQSAYEAGNTIITDSTNGDFDVSGTEAVSLDAQSASNFTVAGAGLTLSTTTSGNISVTSAGNFLSTTGAGSTSVGGEFDITTGAGDDTYAGGAIDFNTGAGGAASGAAGGAGGPMTVDGGTGGAAVEGVTPYAGGAGGSFTFTGGVGGAGDGTDTGGNTGGDAGAGGVFSVTGGVGGAGQAGTVDPAQPGVGADVSLTGGAGGAGAGTSDNADGGDVVLTGGAPGTGGSGTAGTRGTVRVVSGGDYLHEVVQLENTTETVQLFAGSAVPDTAVTGLAGSLYMRDTGSTGEVYVNTSNGSGTSWSKLDVSGVSSADRQDVYDNQGVTPVDLTSNAILDLEGAGLVWSIRDDAEATLFSVTEGSAGGTSAVTFGGDVDTFDCNAVANDFAVGLAVDAAGGVTDTIYIGLGGTVNGETGVANTIQPGSGGDLTVRGGAASGDSGDLTLSTQTGGTTATNNPGNISITGGASGAGAGTAGGDVSVTTGAGDGVGNGGALSLLTGNGGATSGVGGELDLTAGNGAGTGNGGAIDINAGSGGGGATGDGGSVTIDAGPSTATNGSGGSITLTAGIHTGSGTPGVTSVRTGTTGVDEEDPVLALSNQGTGTGGGSSIGQFVIESDPSSVGITANVGSFAFRNNGGSGTTGQAWLKTGSGDTAWTQLTTGSSAVTRNFFQDTISTQVAPGTSIQTTDLTGGALPVKPSSGFTFDLDAQVFLNGVLLMNGTGNEVTSGTGNEIDVESGGPTFRVNDVVTVIYYTNSTNNTA